MRMIPPVLGELTQSAAERRVFGLLERTRLSTEGCCFHSLSLSSHDYKLCAEIDFLVVTRNVVIVLEVKGGGVARHDGIWLFTDRFGVEHRKSEGPFEQAKSGMYALRDRLSGQFGWKTIRRMIFGFGVVFPDCDFGESSVEWDPATILDSSRLRGAGDITAPLGEMIEYWATKHHSTEEPTAGFHERLLRFLRPSFERIPSLRNKADALDAAMEALTEEQYSRLDIIQENPRILCSGGAGTGKTFLAIEVARRHAARGQRVLFVCSGRSLAAFLRTRVKSAHVRIAVADDLAQGGAPYEVLIVDEGQDLINFDVLGRLEDRIEGGLERGTWRFFYDANGQAGLLGRFDAEALEFLRSLGAASATLSLNCRNTNEIVIQTKLVTGADLGAPSAGAGPPVHYEYYDGRATEVDLIDGYWKRLSAEDVAPGEVTILSPANLEQSCITSTRLFKETKVLRVTEEVALHWPSANLTFSTIAEFKGLENRFILLVDLEEEEAVGRLRNELYVGMTRARAGLWIAANTRLRNYIASMAEKNMAAVLTDANQDVPRPQ